MRFNQATKAPLILEVGEQKLSVPKFTLRDQVAWAAELDAARSDQATKGMEELKRFHTLNTYDLFPTDLSELSRRVKTPAGIDRVCSTCLARATWVGGDGKPIGEAKAREIMEGNTEGLEWLAVQLADIRDASVPPAVPEKIEAGESADPLSGSATP